MRPEVFARLAAAVCGLVGLGYGYAAVVAVSSGHAGESAMAGGVGVCYVGAGLGILLKGGR